MSKTESAMIPLGTKAPDFQLLDATTRKFVPLNDSKTYKGTIIAFICNHCPYVKHINSQLTVCAKDYMARGFRFIAINSNDVENYPDDSPEHMKQTAKDQGYPFPYLYDETQDVAKAYCATCTPDFFIFDSKLTLVYRGQFDDSRPGNEFPVTGDSVRAALDCLLHDKPIDFRQKPSLGCNVKWKE